MSSAPSETRQQVLQNATDAELLMRFSKTRDNSCFEVIESRYSRLVYHVCRTVLMNASDAEDACQATFLILVRKSNSLMNVNSLGAWLYKVAYRLSVRANQTKRRQSCASLEQEPPAEIDQFHQISRKEILSGVFQELARLPAKHQQVLVECYLQGKSYREVADQVDSTETVIKGRVAQAKKVLRRRLLKRGIALSFVLVMLEQVRSEAVANLPGSMPWTESINSVLTQPTTSLKTSIQMLSQTGIRRMSMLFVTKPLTIATLAVLVTCLPVLWIMNQPVGAQDSGIALQETTKANSKSARIQTTEADRFADDSTSTNRTANTAKGKADRPVTRQADPFRDDPSATRPDPVAKATATGSRKTRSSTTQADPFGSGKTDPQLDPFGNSSGNRSSRTKQADPFGPGETTTSKTRISRTATIEPKSTSGGRASARNSKSATSNLSAELKIEKALEEPADFDFVDTPLVDVADFLSDELGVAIHVDRIALEDEGLDADTPITGASQKRSLRSALGFIFRETDLAFVTKNETLIITTPTAIANNSDDYLVSKLYDVTKLALNDVESVINTVQQTVDADSWSDQGGYGSMNVLELGNKTIFAVSHTSEHHYRIRKLLDSLEQLAGNN